jgi:Tfp pilus assembly protein PilO
MAQNWRGSYTRYKEFFLNISTLYEKRSDVRAFLEIILSLSTVIIFLIFALKPTAITIVDLLQQIKERKETLSALTQKVTDLSTVNGIIQQNQNYIPDIDSAIPTIPNPDVLSEQTEGLAAKNSIEILGISVNQIPLVGSLTNSSTTKYAPLPENVNEMPFSISVKGSFSNLILFIHDFQNMRIATKIDTLSINSSVSNNGLNIVAVISGRVPYIGK